MRLADALTKEVRLCLLGPRQWESHLQRLNLTVNFKPFDKPRLRQCGQQLRTVHQLLQTIESFKPDVIHIQKGHFWFNLALPLLKQYPVVFTIHDPRQHAGDWASKITPQRLLDFGFRRATQIIVHTNKMAQIVIKELDIPSEMIHVIPHIALGYTGAQTQVPEEENLILFFGRIWKYKGLDYLIKAEPFITAQAPNAKIMIAGQGEDLAPYQRMMVHPDQFIILNEYIPDEKLAELFQRASVVVLPYIEATQSGVIPIAYTFKKPVVATEVGGLPEQVEHGRTGYLIPPCDEKILADTIISLLHNKKLRHQLGANGQQKLETEWAASVVARQTLPVYSQAINLAGSTTNKLRKLKADG